MYHMHHTPEPYARVHVFIRVRVHVCSLTLPLILGACTNTCTAVPEVYGCAVRVYVYMNMYVYMYMHIVRHAICHVQ